MGAANNCCRQRSKLRHCKNPNRKDGRISDFKIVVDRLGTVVVDESVRSRWKKLTRVDALPAGIAVAGTTM